MTSEKKNYFWFFVLFNVNNIFETKGLKKIHNYSKATMEP